MHKQTVPQGTYHGNDLSLYFVWWYLGAIEEFSHNEEQTLETTIIQIFILHLCRSGLFENSLWIFVSKQYLNTIEEFAKIMSWVRIIYRIVYLYAIMQLWKNRLT